VTTNDPAPPSSPDGGRTASDSGAPTALIFGAISAVLVLLVGSILVLGVVGILSDDDGTSSGGGVDGAAPAAATTIDVELSEFSIDGLLMAQPGQVTLDVINEGTQDHDLQVTELGAATPMLSNGETAALDLGSLSEGTYELFCSVAGHRESGMVTELVISEDVGEGNAAAELEASDGGHDMLDGEALDAKMMESMLAYPSPTEGEANGILEPEILPDGTKKFVLEASVIDWEVSPGKFVEGWAYNGQIPGPQIVVDVGDNVQVELTNNTPLGTDIHWHGIQVPNDQDGVAPFTQDPILPGETFTYEFVADRASIGMYHAHFHSQISVLNGMFAAFRIGERPYPRGQTISGVTIPEDFEPDVELPMILNDAGTIGLTLNGKSFPATEPLVVSAGDWVAADYYNEGLTSHPMHQHQFPQLVYAKDGIALDQPYWADTVNVAPGERYSVLFHAEDPGVWVWHCHILTHVEREEGMFGMVTAVIVE